MTSLVDNHGPPEEIERRDASSRENLQFLRSPFEDRHWQNLADSPHRYSLHDADGSKSSQKQRQINPLPRKEENASLLELFYDLFFAANFTVFSEIKSFSSEERIKSYIGYFSLIWITWLSVGFYDVRFVTDSMFERITRAVQLGVMVAFAVVAPYLDPDHQEHNNMREMSLILFISRMTLVLDYGAVVWHARRFKAARTGLLAQFSLHLISALVYLGTSFAFENSNSKSRAFVAWYIVSGLEAIGTLVMSNCWSVLSFTSTDLMRRTSLLTVIVLGDGVLVMTRHVVRIVDTPEAWNPVVIGIVTSCTATTYFMFLIYFDWMKYDHLPPWRQQLWVALHYPFHLALIMFIEGFNEFILWSKVVSVLQDINLPTIFSDSEILGNVTSAEVRENVTQSTTNYFAQNLPQSYEMWQTAHSAMANLSTIPNSFWAELAKYENNSIPYNALPQADITKVEDILSVLLASIENTVFTNYGIELGDDHASTTSFAWNSDDGDPTAQTDINTRSWQHYILVFKYGYIAAGATLIMLLALSIVCRITPWKSWPIVRSVINFLLAVSMGCVTLILTSHSAPEDFLMSPWVLPLLALVWFVVLTLTHVNTIGPHLLSALRRAFYWLFFPQRRRERSRSVEVGDPPDPPIQVSPTEPSGNEEDSRRRSTFGYGPDGLLGPPTRQRQAPRLRLTTALTGDCVRGGNSCEREKPREASDTTEEDANANERPLQPPRPLSRWSDSDRA